MGTDNPFVLVHLSDPHIGATWAAVDPIARFRATVTAIRRGPDRADAIIVSGDLADHGAPDEYAVVKEELASIAIPVHVVPGNHDDRRTLRSYFELPGEHTAPIDYTADVGPLRLVMLDSTVPGEDRGDLALDQLTWLETTLRTAPKRPTLLVMHHPPMRTGVTPWDRDGLADRARIELDRIVGTQPQVCGLVAGHLHRTIAACIGSRVALTIPSTYVQAKLDLKADEFLLAEDEPPAFALHTCHDSNLVSHVQPVIASGSSVPAA